MKLCEYIVMDKYNGAIGINNQCGCGFGIFSALEPELKCERNPLPIGRWQIKNGGKS